MLNIVLCDDNRSFLSSFEDMVRKEYVKLFPDYSHGFSCAAFGSAEEVLAHMKTNSVDVVFLDIDMPGMNGFELAKIIGNDYKNVIVVFISGYDNLVYRSFEFFPFAYLRKGNLEEDLSNAFVRIAKKLSKASKKMVFSSKEGEVIVYTKDILYFESNHNYYTVHCTKKRNYECRGTLAQLEELLSGNDFFRIHSAFLVNMAHVSRVDDGCFVLIEGNMLPLAQKRAVNFRQAYAEYTRRYMGI